MGACCALLTVFAASSLRDAFQDLGRNLEQQHPGTSVAFNFAGSQELRTQVEHGARADVFASADPRTLRARAGAGLALEPQVFARNEPVIVVPARRTPPSSTEPMRWLRGAPWKSSPFLPS